MSAPVISPQFGVNADETKVGFYGRRLAVKETINEGNSATQRRCHVVEQPRRRGVDTVIEVDMGKKNKIGFDLQSQYYLIFLLFYYDHLTQVTHRSNVSLKYARNARKRI